MAPRRSRRVTPEVAFGQVVRELRREQGLSQEALAFACELSREYVSRIERGLNLPSVRTVLALSNVLKTPTPVIFQRFEEHLGQSGSGGDSSGRQVR